MELKKFFERTRKQEFKYRIILADGESISVQASRLHYCEPEESYLSAYSKIEVGFPSFIDERLMEYAEEPEHPTLTVYARVPFELVETIITEHGGIDIKTYFVKQVGEYNND